MFAAQVLTLVTGVASIFVRNRFLASFPVITCATVIGLMTYALQVLLKRNFALITPGPGYWLTYPSVLLFLLAFVLGQTSRRDLKEITSAPAQTHTITYAKSNAN
jgi:hypothetical protein